MERGNCAEKPAPFNLTVYGCDGLEQWKLIVQKYIDNMISQFHGIVLMQIGFILAFFAASRYCKQFTHRPCPVLQWSRLLTALQNDDLRRAVQLSLTGCCNLAEMADNFRKKAIPHAACCVLRPGSVCCDGIFGGRWNETMYDLRAQRLEQPYPSRGKFDGVQLSTFLDHLPPQVQILRALVWRSIELDPSELVARLSSSCF